MQLGIMINFGTDVRDRVDEVVAMEGVGLDIVHLAEGYSYDAVSALGFLAARTSTLRLATGILQIYTRTPTLTAMTAAGLDNLSRGRFVLGVGASGPQVIEGFHGVPFDAPVARTRELIDICRKVWRRERLVHDGRHYHIPLSAEQGTGVGKALKLVHTPDRASIPVVVAALGRRNVEMTAEVADGWMPTMFDPSRYQTVWGKSLAAGSAKRDASLWDLKITVSPPLAIGPDADAYLPQVKAHLAFYIGGMGSRKQNFYHDVATAYGYGDDAERIQELFLSGRQEQAIAAVPDEFAYSTSWIGDAGTVARRVEAFAAAGDKSIRTALSLDDTHRSARTGSLRSASAVFRACSVGRRSLVHRSIAT
ncbi:LLM class F420-dependent oxidoreductase [Rhodococcus sp. IEGM 1381]|uniref:LLM class F420-dependent oxidoreductase n=1 Tax=Rhodococcus sp. IEGM 1381 TaxID=3047085 RepID=UPI0024B6BE48|nr:LLM class F420-dependent oxidoreductase [Rhodococcus sp. IEGM 1381]MDI9897388.1 LLM class F420-dependent oxidoreductase [Rhodococcus sp. IEGM 1381]